MKNIFDPTDVQELVSRINNLNPQSQNEWGKMNVAQMMAHCNVAYDMTYTDKYPKPKGFKKFMIKLFAKNMVVGPKPYKRNLRTAPEFLIVDERDFEMEKQKLIAYLEKTQQLGAPHFQNKESHAFGPLTSQEWNTLFYKHLNHHLQQFNV
ncbi:DUF1569 domain-containing protein [Zobellia galactanivorans]|uniref:DUF1569 domain-containing protein n=1 Tax=Zobellia TaxID=112040 RepID=UPI000B52E829|nr:MULTISPECIES: DUF1569 domain-containing protein [Zobellia]MBU3025165.1 DUF1569 domain-containing protein [Zobellia galactanivorans]MDO6810584.1 DUF1569 domain-containing protein [Zobellia galactanivorans]OWW25248.1 hypothetical protein B4Q04_11980 [Zobellia sp. OII3]